MGRFAELVNDRVGAGEWKRVEADFGVRTQQFWKEGWFRDFDARSGKLVMTTEPDPAQSGPIFCGMASKEQKRDALKTLRSMFERSREQQSGWDNGLAWSSLVLPYLEAVWATGERALAGEVVASIAERIYASMDRRQVSGSTSGAQGPKLGWPGVSCEIWGAHGAMGGEGYGWGAVMPAHIIRTLFGLRETGDPNRLMVCPNLPLVLAIPARRYALRGFQFGQRRLNLQYEVTSSGDIQVTGHWNSGPAPHSIVDEKANKIEMHLSEAEWRFTAVNHGAYILSS